MQHVLIFDVPTKKNIRRRVHEAMAADGVPFLGGAETTMNIEDDLVSERSRPAE